MTNTILKKIKSFPSSPGVYQFIDASDRIIYVGKAASLKSRVGSYFAKPLDSRIEQMVNSAIDIKFIKTDTVIEALVLEANLIKKFLPVFNIRAKDDKTFVNIAISDEEFPRVFITRPNREENVKAKYLFGPYTSAKQARTALKILRKIFPFRTNCKPNSGRACLDYHLKLCPGVCIDEISAEDYQKNISHLATFLSGKKQKLLARLNKEMKTASQKHDYEKAAKIRDQIFALTHIRDVALISEPKITPLGCDFGFRIEAYDISNIFGGWAVGSMTVVIDSQPDTREYRKFRIKSRSLEKRGEGRFINDLAMMAEILERRLKHLDWPKPDLIVIDGGRAHLNLAKKILKNFRLKIPLTAIAKGPTRKKNDFFYDSENTKKIIEENQLLKKSAILARDEAHRFAVKYHRGIRDTIDSTQIHR